MASRRPSQLRILRCPAPEAWFTPTAEGTYCSKCTHHVHDLGELDESEAMALLESERRTGARQCIRCETTPDGRVRFRNGVGALSLTILSGCAPWSSSEATTTQSPQPLDLELVDSNEDATRPSIAGYILDHETGEPIDGALVILQSKSISTEVETLTNEHGVYRFYPLPPGQYTVQVLSGKANVSRIVEIQAGQAARVDFRVELNQRWKTPVGMMVR